MVIFIPSWYANYPKWSQEFIPWYFWGNQMSFDDTISQLKIFQEQQQEIQLLVLNYFPHLRTLFMRYGLHELPTLSKRSTPSSPISSCWQHDTYRRQG